jgi:hypothetical protein
MVDVLALESAISRQKAIAYRLRRIHNAGEAGAPQAGHRPPATTRSACGKCFPDVGANTDPLFGTFATPPRSKRCA